MFCIQLLNKTIGSEFKLHKVSSLEWRRNLYTGDMAMMVDTPPPPRLGRRSKLLKAALYKLPIVFTNWWPSCHQLAPPGGRVINFIYWWNNCKMAQAYKYLSSVCHFVKPLWTITYIVIFILKYHLLRLRMWMAITMLILFYALWTSIHLFIYSILFRRTEILFSHANAIGTSSLSDSWWLVH